MNDSPRKVLKKIVKDPNIDKSLLIDAELGFNPKLIKSMLKDHCSEHKGEISVLIDALEERVVSDLIKPNSEPSSLLLAQLARRLQDNRGLDEKLARWAIESWIIALGKQLPKEDRRSRWQPVVGTTILAIVLTCLGLTFTIIYFADSSATSSSPSTAVGSGSKADFILDPAVPSPPTRSTSDQVEDNSSSPSPDAAISSEFNSTRELVLSGLITVEHLNVRSGPGITYSLLAKVTKGDEVTILGRTSESNWLLVQAPGNREGWVSRAYVKVSGEINENDIPLVDNIPTPGPEDASPTSLTSSSVSARLAAGQEKWYTFYKENSQTTNIVLMFSPNTDVEFLVYDEQQVPSWPLNDPDQVGNVGAGSRAASDRDGDLGTGELIWNGGEQNMLYYLRVVNRGTSQIHYCLSMNDVYEWTCH